MSQVKIQTYFFHYLFVLQNSYQNKYAKDLSNLSRSVLFNYLSIYINSMSNILNQNFDT